MATGEEEKVPLLGGDPLNESAIYEEDAPKGPVDSALGKKTIHLFGSFVLNINNLCGPGMLAVPIVYQQAGWLLPTATLIILLIISSYSSTLLCEAMAMIPGNDKFQKRIEFSTVVEYYFGRRAYAICQIVYSISLTTLNVASIIVCTQVMDQFAVFAFGKSFAFAFQHFKFIETTSLAAPFAGEGIVITLGYAATMILCMPMGFLNLDENIYFQYVSFASYFVIIVEFFVDFFTSELRTDLVPMVGTNISQVVGTIMFSYTFVVTIPSWVNEKKENVSVNVAVWGSTIICTIMYFLMGYIGALAYPNVDPDILTSLASKQGASLLTQISVYLFNFGVIGLGIPLFSVMVRYNLYVGKVFGKAGSAFFGAVFPWLVSFFLYQGNGFETFVAWSSLFVNSFINFALPMVIYVKARQIQRKNMAALAEGSVNVAASDAPQRAESQEGESAADEVHSSVHALPKCCNGVKSSMIFAVVILVLVSLLTVVAIVYQFITEV